jgi:insertion element IS1 protein InsB
MSTLCSKCVDTHLQCLQCFSNVSVKNGKTKSGKQRLVCKNCKVTIVVSYSYNAYNPDLNKNIVLLTKEGLGIRSTANIDYNFT